MVVTSPNELSGCILWLDADDTNTLYASTSTLNTNLILFSENLETTSWTKTGTTASTILTSTPFNTPTAILLTENALSSTHVVAQSRTVTPDVYTGSIYVKDVNRQYVSFYIYSGTSSATRAGITIDLQNNGAVTQVLTLGTPLLTSFNVQNAGDGWYRISVSMQCTNIANGTGIVLNLSDSPTPSYFSVNTRDYIYTGSNRSVYVDGAQLEVGGVASPYIFTGPVVNSALLPLSGSTTINYILSSNIFSGWSSTATTLSSRSGLSPTGEPTADKLLDNTTLSHHLRWYPALSTPLNRPVSFSVYARKAERRYVNLTVEGGIGSTLSTFSAVYDILSGSGTVTATRTTGIGILSTASVSAVGNDWYRCSITGTVSAVPFATGPIYPIIALSDRPDYTTPLASNTYQQYSTTALTSGGLFIWGAQFEFNNTTTTYVSSLSTFGTNFTPSLLLDDQYIPYWQNKALSSTVLSISALTNIGAITIASSPVYKTNAYNNRSVLRFNGTNALTCYYPGMSLSGQTVFVVAALSGAGTGDRLYTQNDTSATDATSNAQYIPLYRPTGSPLQIASYANVAVILPVNIRSRDRGLLDVVSSNHSLSTINNFVNGLPNTSTTTHNFGYSIISSRVGAALPTGGQLIGDIAEVIVYNRSLTYAERGDVEYYLAKKWNLPRIVYAVQDGNWSSGSTWSVDGYGPMWEIPLSSDSVYTNSYNVTASNNITVFTAGTVPLLSGIVPGGTIILNAPISAIFINGITSGTSTCVTVEHTTGTAVISGSSIIGGSGANANGILHSGQGNLIVNSGVGIIGGSGADANGVLHSSRGNLTVYSSVTGGSSAGANGINRIGTGILTIVGTELRGGSNATAGGLVNRGANNVFINCNVLGRTGPGCNNFCLEPLFITGTVIGGSGSTSGHGVVNSGIGEIYISGDIVGGGLANVYGVSNSNLGNIRCIVPGTVRGGTSAATTHGIVNSSGGVIYITGNVIGGTTSNTHGILNSSLGTLFITGNVTGGSGTDAHGISQTYFGNVYITGTITASTASNGIKTDHDIDYVELCGNFINNSNGRTAVYARTLRIKPTANSYMTVALSSGGITNLYIADVYSIDTVPPVSSVASGVTYGALSAANVLPRIGTMVVPDPNTVEFNVNVSNTKGTAVISNKGLQNLWDIDLDNIKQPDSIGMRLKNTATLLSAGNMFMDFT